MDSIALAHRIQTRVAELESRGKKVSAIVKRHLRQAPKHAYRNDTLEKIARELDWSVAELVEGVWREGENVNIYGLERHQVCLRFARRMHDAAPTALAVPANALDALELEDLVATLYQIWRDMERGAGKPIDPEIMIEFWKDKFSSILDPDAVSTSAPPVKLAS